MENRIEYRLGDNILNTLEEIFYNNGRIDFASPNPEKSATIKTGIGGLAAVNRLLQKMANKAGLQASKLEPSSTGHTGIVSYTIPFLAKVEFVLDPSQDTPPANETENPMIEGFKQSSYHYTVEQGEGIGNIQLICVGKRPVFREELRRAIMESGADKDYDTPMPVMMKYIMNCLKNLE